jgi:anti-sigma B factor antagonist
VSLEFAPGSTRPSLTASARRPELLEIDTSWAEDVALLVLSGELDVSSIERLGERFADLTAATQSDVFVDVSRLTYIDSIGLSFLVKAHRTLEARGNRLIVVFATSHLQHLFEICGLTWLLVDDPSSSRNQPAS